MLDALVGRDAVIDDATRHLTHGVGVLLVGRPGAGVSRVGTELVRRHPTAILVDEEDLNLEAGRDTAADLAPARSELARTVASGDVPVIATAHAHLPLPPPLARAWTRGTLVRIDVPPLNGDQIAELARAQLGGSVSVGVEVALAAATDGLPLFLRELLLDAVAEQLVVPVDGVWIRRGELAPGPRTVMLAEARMASLTEEDRAALATVALARGASPGAIADLVDLVSLDRCERAGLVAARPDGFTIVPPVMADAVERSLTGARRISIQRRISADVLARLDSAEPLRLRAASWAVDSGQPVDPELAIQGATHALLEGRVAAATRLARAALAGPADARARLVLGEIQRFNGDPMGAIEAVRPLTRPGRPATERVPALRLTAMALHYGLGRYPNAVATLRQAAGPWDRASRARLQRLAWTHDLNAGFFTEAVPALAGDLTALPAEEVAPICSALALAAAMAGRGQAAVAYGRRAVTAAQSSPELRLDLPEALTSLYTALHLAGLAGSAEESGLPTADELMASPRDAAVTQLGLALPLLLAGRAREAMAQLALATAALTLSDPSGYLRVSLVLSAHASAMLGRAEDARRFATEADRTPERASGALRTELAASLLWVAQLDGPAALAEALERTVAMCQEAGAPGSELIGRHTAMRLGAPLDLPRVETLVAKMDSPRHQACAEHCAAMAADDAERLLRASAALESVGETLCSLEAAASARRIARSQGRRETARMAAVQTRRLATIVGGLRLPTLLDWDLDEPLTRREREVTALASQGLTNAQIAERLDVSRRTVEGHLYRAYTKLGVTDRARL